MSRKRSRLWLRLLSIAIGTLFLAALSTASFAQDDAAPEEAVSVEEVLTAEMVQVNLDQTWILLAGFLVFFMQAGFAMLEGGFIGAKGVVNSMAENFMDAAVTGIVFFLVGYGIAYADPSGSGFFSMPVFALGGIDGTGAEDGMTLVGFFFQFAFAGAAATIATGAMAERTDFRGKIIYSALIALIIYPVVVFWTWGGGWLTQLGFLDFAGSTIVHQTGGVIALVGAMVVGPRAGRIFGKAPAPSNLMLATLGTFILWFGWYGFNVGSTLGASDVNALGLVAVNTTLAACAGALSAMLYAYMTQGGKWDLPLILNGSLAGLVGITAGCAFVSPVSSMIIGVLAGVLVVVTISVVEAAKIDDAVGAFAVHGACGMLGTLAIGIFGIPALTGTAGGVLMGGGFDQLIAQAIGVVAVGAWTAATSFIMFSVLKAAGLLRVGEMGLQMGIDAYEHGASVMPDLLRMPGESGIAASESLGTSAAVGD